MLHQTKSQPGGTEQCGLYLQRPDVATCCSQEPWAEALPVGVRPGPHGASGSWPGQGQGVGGGRTGPLWASVCSSVKWGWGVVPAHKCVVGLLFSASGVFVKHLPCDLAVSQPVMTGGAVILMTAFWCCIRFNEAVPALAPNPQVSKQAQPTGAHLAASAAPQAPGSCCCSEPPWIWSCQTRAVSF